MVRRQGSGIAAAGITPRLSRHDLLYNPRFSVPEFTSISKRWEESSRQARGSLDCYLDVAYGNSPSERMDVFRSQGPSRATLLFIHGGYWRAQDKAGYSFLAPELTRAGITLAVPNYALCPNVEVRDIVIQMVQACAWIYRNASNFGAPENKLYLCGHSAGGHLSAMMLTCLWPVYSADLPVKVVRGALSISGLFDLREIVRTPSINTDVRLTRSSALAVSPAFLPPATDAPLHLAVGAKETGGFHAQHRIISSSWKRNLGVDLVCPGDNHFTVLENLEKPDSALFKSLLRMLAD